MAGVDVALAVHQWAKVALQTNSIIIHVCIYIYIYVFVYYYTQSCIYKMLHLFEVFQCFSCLG